MEDCYMKKVRLALGAMGVAPALGLIMPGAAVAATRAPAGTADPASHVRSKVVRLDTDTGCRGTEMARKSYSELTLWAYHTPSTGCVGGVSEVLSQPQTHLYLRTRVYTINGGGTKTKVYSNYTSGTINQGHTSFYQGIHHVYGGVKQQVCGALVVTTKLSSVQYPPICVSFAT
jgi:hypothetical protein